MHESHCFFPRVLYSSSDRSSVRTGVFCDVALHVITVMKSKAAGSLYLSRPALPAYLGRQRAAARRGYPSVALTCGSPKMSRAGYLCLPHHQHLLTRMHIHVQCTAFSTGSVQLSPVHFRAIVKSHVSDLGRPCPSA